MGACSAGPCVVLARRSAEQSLANLQGSCTGRFRDPSAACSIFCWTMSKLDRTDASDRGVLSHELGELWWSLLPELACAARGVATDSKQAGLYELKRRLRLDLHRMPDATKTS